MEHTRKPALYVRTSTDHQTNGLESQKRALLEYCAKAGINDYYIFEDSGISGTKASRPALDEMMGHIALGRISAVVVYSFSRLARSTRHLLEASEIFKRNNVSFISYTEKIDTASPIGNAFFVILAALAELERDLIVERVKNGMANARAKGKQIGRVKIRDDELIRSLRASGLSYKKIAQLAKVSEGTVCNALRGEVST